MHIFLTNILFKHGIISKDEIDEYQYGIEVLMLKCLHLSSILIISLTLGFLIESIVFLLVYNNIRGTIGGYHAKTKIICLIFTILITLALYLILISTSFYENMILILILELFVSISIFVLNRNMRHKNKLNLNLLFILFLSFLCYLLNCYAILLATTYALFISLLLYINKR